MTSNLNRILDRSIHRDYHKSCSVWLRKRGKDCSPLGRGDLLLLLLLWYLLLYLILQLKLFPFCLPRCILVCTLYLMGNYSIEPVEPLDYNPSFYQPMRETATNVIIFWYPSGPGQLMLMIHRKPFQFATNGHLLSGKTALKESDQNIRQFKTSQKWLIHVTSPYNIQTLSSKQIMIILKLIGQKLPWSYIKCS